VADPEVVVRLLAAIDEVERPELAARGDHEMSWELFGDDADMVRAQCHHCDWSLADRESVVNQQADEHVRRCVSMPVSPVLRLCQAHRDIVAEWRKREQMADQLAAEGYVGDAVVAAEAIVAGLFASVILLARGYGIEDGETT
jgi:hypothetical protein